jgi:hypothetical protein
MRWITTRKISAPTFGTNTPAQTVVLTIEPAAPPRPQAANVVLLRPDGAGAASGRRALSPSPRAASTGDRAAREATEIAVAGINSALKIKGIPADLCDRLQQCLRILR